MKHLYFFCFLTILLLFSCKKEEPATNEPPVTEPPILTDPPIIELGKSRFFMNGNEWPGQLKAYYFGRTPNGVRTVKLLGSYLIPNSTFVEKLSISDISTSLGQHHFSCHCDNDPFKIDGIPETLMSWTVDGDQSIGVIKIDTTQTGSYIEVLKYDSIQHTIEGRFDVYLKDRTTPTVNPYYPEEVHLTEGKFNLKIEQ